MARVNSSNYRESVARLEAELKRTNAAGQGTAEAYYVDVIGNMHREFGHLDEARAYYDRAIALARQEASGRPLSSVAFILWKAGYKERMEEECRALLSEGRKLASALETEGKESEESQRKRTLVYLDLAKAAFLLKDYAGARMWAEKGRPAQAQSPTTLDALIDLAGALEVGNAQGFENALRKTRKMLLSWPSFESDSNRELYRVALSFGLDSFGSIPADLKAELFGVG